MKLTIIHLSGGRQGVHQSFAGKSEITLGRHPDCDCLFTESSDSTVSAHHAEIRIVSGRAIILDNDSSNGLFVNDQRIREAQLRPDSRVRLGEGGPEFTVQYAAMSIDPPPSSSAARGFPKGMQPVALDPKLKATSRDLPGSRQRDDATPTGSASEPAPVEPSYDASHDSSHEQEFDDDSSPKYGERTVGLMIQKALMQAGLLRGPGTTKSTDYFKAMVQGSATRQRNILMLAIAAVLLIGAGFSTYIYMNRTVNMTTQINYGDAAGESIAAANRHAVFMLAGKEKSTGKLRGFCSGFAIAADLLATNAHCIALATKQYDGVLALMNSTPDARYPVIRSIAHPNYIDKRISPDVGLVKIQANLSQTVTLAPPEELARIDSGIAVFLYGFPGRLNREDAPEATFIKGDIGRVTTFNQQRGEFASNLLLQHSAFSSTGTSGSPMFNDSGHVIGINAGGYVEDGQPLDGYNFGMRIDLIDSLIKKIGTP